MILVIAFLNMMIVALAPTFVSVPANPELLQTNALIDTISITRWLMGAHITEQFLFTSGVSL
jgi:hypothetical protein